MDSASSLPCEHAPGIQPDCGRGGQYLDECFRGHRLHGDDYSFDELAAWFQDEAEGFADLGAKDRSAYEYEYHALNETHGYQYIPSVRYAHVLSIGGAYGDELLPLSRKIDRITILDPSDAFVVREKSGVPVNYVKPALTGLMPFQDNSFDLATCFGCLHHIPNVSTVIRELHRVLTPSGYAVIREPIVSMGDWRFPRPGLTKRERGIPLSLFRQLIISAGFRIRKETLCVFPLIPRLGILMDRHVYNSRLMVSWDWMLSRLFARNYVYHSSKWLKKFKPTAVALVIEKPAVMGSDPLPVPKDLRG
jgi:SAM-dependent methyltransferase